MTLSDEEIWAEIADGRLVINPPPELGRVGPSSVDLLLHDRLFVLPQVPGDPAPIDPTDPTVLEQLAISGPPGATLATAPFTLAPQQLVMGRTVESLNIPPYLAGRVEGRSSLAQHGLAVHVTAPTIHPWPVPVPHPGAVQPGPIQPAFDAWYADRPVDFGSLRSLRQVGL